MSRPYTPAVPRTREEHIAAARELARLNPEWDAGVDGLLTHRTKPAAVRFGGSDYGWMALRHLRYLRRSGRLSYFATPAAAVRALGFNVKESEG